MGVVSHAKKEFLRAGYQPTDEDQEDGPNKWIQENVMELLDTFSKQGHSGMSAGYCIDAFQKLANYKLLTSIKSIDEFKFGDCIDLEDSMKQSSVISSVFLDIKTNKAYYLDATYFQGEDDYDSFSGGNVAGIRSNQFIKYPFVPKTFPINVKKVDFDENRHDDFYEANNGWHYAYELTNREQLKEIEEYYECDFSKAIVIGE
jgi:hypothetical protein